MNWERIKTTALYKGFLKLEKIDLVHDLFAGGKSPVITRELLDQPLAVAVLPFDPVRDEVVLIEQFRVGAISATKSPWLIEVIAGYQETGESAETVAQREAEEEAGCTVNDLVAISHYYSSPGYVNEQIRIFVARTDSSGIGGIHGLDEEGEDIRVHVISSQQAFDWLDAGRVDSAMAIIALQWLRLNREKIVREWT